MRTTELEKFDVSSLSGIHNHFQTLMHQSLDAMLALYAVQSANGCGRVKERVA